MSIMINVKSNTKQKQKQLKEIFTMKNFIKTITISIVLLATMTLIALGSIAVLTKPKTYTAETITSSNGTVAYSYSYK